MKKIMDTKGITLIALVVTIIVLLILAAVSMSLLLGENGIITKTRDAKERTIVAQEKDQIGLAYSATKIDTLGLEITQEQFQNELNNVVANDTATVTGNGIFNIHYEKTKHNYTLEDGIITQMADSENISYHFLGRGDNYVIIQKNDGKLFYYQIGYNDQYIIFDESNAVLISNNAKLIDYYKSYPNLDDDFYPYVKADNSLYVFDRNTKTSTKVQDNVICESEYYLIKKNSNKLCRWNYSDWDSNTDSYTGNYVFELKELEGCNIIGTPIKMYSNDWYLNSDKELYIFNGEYDYNIEDYVYHTEKVCDNVNDIKRIDYGWLINDKKYYNSDWTLLTDNLKEYGKGDRMAYLTNDGNLYYAGSFISNNVKWYSGEGLDREIYYITNNGDLYNYSYGDGSANTLIFSNIKCTQNAEWYITTDNKLYGRKYNEEEGNWIYVLISENVTDAAYLSQGECETEYWTTDEKLYYWNESLDSPILIEDNYKKVDKKVPFYINNDNELYRWSYEYSDEIEEYSLNKEKLAENVKTYYYANNGRIYYITNNNELYFINESWDYDEVLDEDIYNKTVTKIADNIIDINGKDNFVIYTSSDEIALMYLPERECFVVGTKVLTANGLVNIEDIKAGDKVYTRNEKTGKIEEDEVDFVHITKSMQDIYKVYTDTTYVEVTGNHPFYIKDKGWTRVEELKVGDILINNSNNEIKIANIEIEPNTEGITVYNLKMKNNHNYFAGLDSILVHNKCFEEGTQVQIDLEGNTKPIEELKVGDKVVTYNHETGRNEETIVNETYLHADVNCITEVEFSDGSKVRMTIYHPMYTKEGWKSITEYNGYAQLKEGDEEKTQDSWKTIEKINITIEEKPVNTYTIGVEGSDGFYANGTLVEGL